MPVRIFMPTKDKRMRIDRILILSIFSKYVLVYFIVTLIVSKKLRVILQHVIDTVQLFFRRMYVKSTAPLNRIAEFCIWFSYLVLVSGSLLYCSATDG